MSFPFPPSVREEMLEIAARHGAGNVALFGSAARGELGPDSDVDLLIDIAENIALVPRWARRRVPATAGPTRAVGHSSIHKSPDRRRGTARQRTPLKSDRAYLEHILVCLQRIRENATAGLEAVRESHTLQDAILRDLQVLCESAQRLSEDRRNLHPEIDWRAMNGFRNVLVHDCFGIDLGIAWLAIERDVPALEKAVADLLQRMDA